MSDLIERLDCGHPRELAVLSAETGGFLYCELCDCRQRRNDAETMEQELRAALRAKDEEAMSLRASASHHSTRAEIAEQRIREILQVAHESNDKWLAQSDRHRFAFEQRIREMEAALREAQEWIENNGDEFNMPAYKLLARIDALLEKKA